MGFLKFGYFILLNFIFTLFVFAAEPNHNTQAPTEEQKVKKDETQNSSPEEKKRISEKQYNELVKTVFAVKPADEEKPAVRIKNSNQIIPTARSSNGRPIPSLLFSKPNFVQPDEITTFTPKEIKDAIINLKESGGLDSFLRRAANTQFDKVVNELDIKNRLEKNDNNKIASTSNKSVLVLDEGPAKIGYLLAVERLRQIAATQKYDPEAAAREAAALSKSNLSNGVNKGLTDFTSNPLALADYSNIASNYLDLAAKQISNSTDSPDSQNNGSNLSNPFSGDTELNKLFDNALNTANSSEAGSQKIADRLKPFQNLINSKDFLENAANVLGSQNTNTLVSAVQAAELLNNVGGNLNASAIDYLASAFNLGTGVGAPPCISCVEGKNSSLVTQAENYKASDEIVSKSTQEWIDEANLLADTANRNKSLDSKQIAYMLKGRAELDKLLGELKAYKSLGVLDLVQIPSTKSMSRNYKEAAEIAAGILFIVRQKKIKEGEAPLGIANIKKIKTSASNLLERLKKAQRPSGVELTLRGFFENNENNEIRTLWRKYEDANYKKLRSATAQIIMSRYMAMIKLPSFEKVTLERASLAYLTGQAFKVINEREAQLLKEKQLRLGLQPLQEIRMKGDKAKPKVEEEKIRYPSFIDEEN